MRQLKRELWPHRVVLTKDEISYEFGAMANWLEDQVGQFGLTWNAVRRHDQTDLYFRNRADAVMFSLKWV